MREKNLYQLVDLKHRIHTFIIFTVAEYIKCGNTTYIICV